VICFQNSIFGRLVTVSKCLAKSHWRCDLLSKFYLWPIGNSRLFSLMMFARLWFAFKILSLADW